MSPETLKKLARSVPFNSVPWFDLLDKLGLFERWLTSDSIEQLQYLLWLFGAPNIAQHRSARVANLARPVLAGGGERGRQMLRLFDSGEIHHSRELFDLFLELLKEGAFDSQPSHRWMDMHDLGKKKPGMTAELIAQCLDRLVELASSAQMQSPFGIDLGSDWLQLPESVFDDAARLDPASFVRQVLPRLIRLITKHAFTTEDGRVFDRVWPYRSLGSRHDFRELVFDALCDAMGRLATANPALLDDYTRDLESLPHQNIVSLLLSAWTANSPLFSNRVIDYLLAAPHRLDLGYSSWGGGNGKAAISRGAIKTASVHCDEVHFRRIEKAILDFYTASERRQPKRLGYTQYLLLDSLAELRRGGEAARRIQELARKFPGADLEMPSGGDRGGIVGSPIPEKAVKKMRDDQWISAMRAYPDTKAARANHEDFLKGGSMELSQQLEAETKLDKSRFAALALRMEADIQPVYFDAILRGLVASDERESSQSTKKTWIPPIETSAAVEVIRHIHRLFGTETGRWISHAIAHLAERELPNDLLDMVANFAQNASDPEHELWQTFTVGESRAYGGDPFVYGINTTRGGAAHAIARLLFADEHRFDRLKVGMLAVISDRSLAVRACAIECLLAILNFEPELAVRLFLESLREAEPILKTTCVQPFLHHAVFSHYGVLRELLLSMLRSPDGDVRETAAQQIALASFGFDDAKADLIEVLSADEVCRAAVARVDAENLHVQECMSASRTRLKDFFSDESPNVRNHAAECFHRISDEQLCQESELIDAFLQSPAFQHNVNILLMVLKDAVARLPDVVCRIPERAVELHRGASSNEVRWWTNQMAPLVLRLHEQTTDPVIKKRCLDVIDAMIELDFGGMSFELAKQES